MRVDGVSVTPGVSKTDQTGKRWGDSPTVIPFGGELDAARYLADLLVARQPALDTWLFGDTSGACLAKPWLDALLAHCLALVVPPGEARAYSAHSFRIGAATALFAAGVSLHLVQRVGRWASPSSASIYARSSERLLAQPMAVLAGLPVVAVLPRSGGT